LNARGSAILVAERRVLTATVPAS